VVDARKRLAALAEAKRRPDFAALAVAFKRAANIQEKAQGAGASRVDPALLRDDAERALLSEVERVEGEVATLRVARDYAAVLRAVAGLGPAVDRFFEQVLVMAEDPALRANRLALVRRVAALFSDLADFRKVQAEPAAGAPEKARA
jgi:glycyl-tRNA synthetase beta chain